MIYFSTPFCLFWLQLTNLVPYFSFVRYWNQLNEDVRIILQRFDAETSDENESNNENESTTSFLSQLSNFESISSLTNLDTDEMSEQLQQRVDSSTLAIKKIVQAFDRIVQRNVRVSNAINGVSNINEDGNQLDYAYN